MILEKARVEEVIVESGDRKNADGTPMLNADGTPARWQRKSIRVRQDTRGGNSAVLSLMRSVEENAAVMRDLDAGAVVDVEVGMTCREYKGRYYNELQAWGVTVLQPATL